MLCRLSCKFSKNKSVFFVLLLAFVDSFPTVFWLCFLLCRYNFEVDSKTNDILNCALMAVCSQKSDPGTN